MRTLEELNRDRVWAFATEEQMREDLKRESQKVIGSELLESIDALPPPTRRPAHALQSLVLVARLQDARGLIGFERTLLFAFDSLIIKRYPGTIAGGFGSPRLHPDVRVVQDHFPGVEWQIIDWSRTSCALCELDPYDIPFEGLLFGVYYHKQFVEILRRRACAIAMPALTARDPFNREGYFWIDPIPRSTKLVMRMTDATDFHERVHVPQLATGV